MSSSLFLFIGRVHTLNYKLPVGDIVLSKIINVFYNFSDASREYYKITRWNCYKGISFENILLVSNISIIPRSIPRSSDDGYYPEREKGRQ
ncbi:hypothetical protein V1477_021061 [Vespula maculifrons]|uniref:Uncharacterized protein n=1 Tax=Vespula maculifrons TaxID=7453 RepID=A0ABD2AH13_VESMC